MDNYVVTNYAFLLWTIVGLLSSIVVGIGAGNYTSNASIIGLAGGVGMLVGYFASVVIYVLYNVIKQRREDER